jgi:hypothetical protein
MQEQLQGLPPKSRDARHFGYRNGDDREPSIADSTNLAAAKALILAAYEGGNA